MTLDRVKFTTIAHQGMTLLNPIASADVDRILARLGAPAGTRALDIGCGKGEMLMRLVQRTGGSGVGVDVNRAFLDQARAKAAARRLMDRIELVEMPAREFRWTGPPFGVAMCIGATHAFGDLPATIRGLRTFLGPEGLLLVGEGYWRRPPAAGYLEVLGATEDEMLGHAENMQVGIAAGLALVESWTSSPDDFDRYEDGYRLGIERHAEGHPEDPDVPAMLERIRRWHDGYRRWGRDTLGFGLYLFRVP